jgi:hypothetical protein
MTNPYKEYFLKEHVSDQLYKTRDLDRQHLNSVHESFSSDFIYFNGFVDFCVSDLRLNNEEIVKYSNNHLDYLSEALYGYTYQSNSRRNEMINFFTPVLEKDITFFQSCLKVCLSEHLKNKTYSKHFSEKYNNHFLEENKKIFIDLIKIGQTSQHFNKISPNVFHTLNKEYQLYMEKEEVFNSLYKIEDLISALKNSEMIKKYVSTYIEQIIESLSNNSEDLQKITQGENNTHCLINCLYGNKFEVDSEQYNRFLIDLTKNDEVKKLIKAYTSNQLIENYSELVIPILEGFNEEEKVDFFTQHYINYSNYDIEKKAGGWLNKISKKEQPVSNELWDYFYDNITKYSKELNGEDNIHKFKEVFSLLLLDYCTNKNIKITPQVNDLVSKYMPILISGFSLNSNKNEQYLENLNVLKEFINPELFKKWNSKIVVKAKDELYQVFKNHNEKSNYATYSSKLIANLPKFLELSENYEILEVLNADTLNPLWKQIELTSETRVITAFSNKKKHKVTHKYNYPLSFYLIEKTDGKALDWFLKDENVSNFEQVRCDKKTFMGEFGKQPGFNQLIHKIIEYPEAFKTMVLKNKISLNHMKKIDDPIIQNALSYYQMDKKLPISNELVVKKHKI